MYKVPIFLIAISIALTSCQEVLDEDVVGMEPKTVIDCKILNRVESNLVIVSKTSSYYQDQQDSSFVSNATVIISDNSGIIDTLENYHYNGGYRIHGNKFLNSISKTYTLTVQLEGENYISTSTFPNPVKLDSLLYIYQPNDLPARKQGYYPVAYFTDPPDKKNYYLWKFYKNGEHMDVSNLWLTIDNNIKGMEFPYTCTSGDIAHVELNSLTKEAYDFYYSVNQQLTNDGGFFSLPPANVPSNFSNGALGLFETSTRDSLSIVLP